MADIPVGPARTARYAPLLKLHPKPLLEFLQAYEAKRPESRNAASRLFVAQRMLGEVEEDIEFWAQKDKSMFRGTLIPTVDRLHLARVGPEEFQVTGNTQMLWRVPETHRAEALAMHVADLLHRRYQWSLEELLWVRQRNWLGAVPEGGYSRGQEENLGRIAKHLEAFDGDSPRLHSGRDATYLTTRADEGLPPTTDLMVGAFEMSRTVALDQLRTHVQLLLCKSDIFIGSGSVDNLIVKLLRSEDGYVPMRASTGSREAIFLDSQAIDAIRELPS